MKNEWLAVAMILLLAVVGLVVVSCGGDDDDDDDDDDEYIPTGTCEGYCQKNISCGDTSWNNVDACAEACEDSPNRDCVLSCETGETCGNWFDCLSGCS